MLSRFFTKALGSEKSYLFFKLQIAIFLSIFFSILYTLFKSDLYLLQIVPALLLAFSLAELRKKSPQDFLASTLIFSAIYLLVLLTLFFSQLTALVSSSPIELIKYMIYVVFAILLVLVVSRTFLLKKEIYGRVILADRKTAVVDIDFDFLAGIKPGKYVVENKGAKKGDLVRISVQKGFFKGSYPKRIIGKRT